MTGFGDGGFGFGPGGDGPDTVATTGGPTDPNSSTATIDQQTPVNLPPGLMFATDNYCGFSCNLLGGPVEGPLGPMGPTYNHQFFSLGSEIGTTMVAGGMITGGVAIGCVVTCSESGVLGGVILGAKPIKTLAGRIPAAAESVLGPRGPIFGRERLGGRSILNINSNDYLRVGWGWKGSGQTGTSVFRISGDALDMVTGVERSHIDLFTSGWR